MYRRLLKKLGLGGKEVGLDGGAAVADAVLLLGYRFTGVSRNPGTVRAGQDQFLKELSDTFRKIPAIQGHQDNVLVGEPALPFTSCNGFVAGNVLPLKIISPGQTGVIHKLNSCFPPTIKAFDLIEVSPEFNIADWDRATCSCFVPTCVLEPSVQSYEGYRLPGKILSKLEDTAKHVTAIKDLQMFKQDEGLNRNVATVNDISVPTLFEKEGCEYLQLVIDFSGLGIQSVEKIVGTTLAVTRSDFEMEEFLNFKSISEVKLPHFPRLILDKVDYDKYNSTVVQSVDYRQISWLSTRAERETFKQEMLLPDMVADDMNSKLWWNEYLILPASAKKKEDVAKTDEILETDKHDTQQTVNHDIILETEKITKSDNVEVTKTDEIRVYGNTVHTGIDDTMITDKVDTRHFITGEIMPETGKIVRNGTIEMVNTDETSEHSDPFITEIDESMEKEADETSQIRDTTIAERGEPNGIIKSFVADIDDTSHASESLEADNDDKCHKRDSLMAEKDELKHTSDTLFAEKDELMDKNATLMVEKDDLTHKSDTMMAEENDFTHRHETMVAEKGDLTPTHDTRNAEKDDLTPIHDTIMSEIDDLIHTYDSMMAEKDDLTPTHVTMNAEKGNLTYTDDTMIAEKDDFTHTHDKMMTEKDDMTHRSDTMIAEKDEVLHKSHTPVVEWDYSNHTSVPVMTEKDDIMQTSKSLKEQQDVLSHTSKTHNVEKDDPVHTRKTMKAKKVETDNKVKAKKDNLDPINETVIVEKDDQDPTGKTLTTKKDDSCQLSKTPKAIEDDLEHTSKIVKEKMEDTENISKTLKKKKGNTDHISKTVKAIMEDTDHTPKAIEDDPDHTSKTLQAKRDDLEHTGKSVKEKVGDTENISKAVKKKKGDTDHISKTVKAIMEDTDHTSKSMKVKMEDNDQTSKTVKTKMEDNDQTSKLVKAKMVDPDHTGKIVKAKKEDKDHTSKAVKEKKADPDHTSKIVKGRKDVTDLSSKTVKVKEDDSSHTNTDLKAKKEDEQNYTSETLGAKKDDTDLTRKTLNTRKDDIRSEMDNVEMTEKEKVGQKDETTEVKTLDQVQRHVGTEPRIDSKDSSVVAVDELFSLLSDSLDNMDAYLSSAENEFLNGEKLHSKINRVEKHDIVSRYPLYMKRFWKLDKTLSQIELVNKDLKVICEEMEKVCSEHFYHEAMPVFRTKKNTQRWKELNRKLHLTRKKLARSSEENTKLQNVQNEILDSIISPSDSFGKVESFSKTRNIQVTESGDCDGITENPMDSKQSPADGVLNDGKNIAQSFEHRSLLDKRGVRTQLSDLLEEKTGEDDGQVRSGTENKDRKKIIPKVEDLW